jgi:hypothetical protein
MKAWKEDIGHWCGVPGIFGLEGARVLEFARMYRMTGDA